MQTLDCNIGWRKNEVKILILVYKSYKSIITIKIPKQEIRHKNVISNKHVNCVAISIIKLYNANFQDDAK